MKLYVEMLFFVAGGVTDGELLKGIRIQKNNFLVRFARSSFG